jgi:hypothetical protein
MAGKIKKLEFAEGIATQQPAVIPLPAELIASYASIAAFEAENTPEQGSVFWDTTAQTLQTYGVTGWFTDGRDITKEQTGFTNNQNIVVSYDSSTRKVTLTGTFEGYFLGKKVAALVSGWESSAHDAGDGSYFLTYDGIQFAWQAPASVSFTSLLIAYVVVLPSASFALREVHGLLQHEAHKLAHETIGTYVKSGGDLSSYTLASTTATNRRPQVAETVVIDEDLASTLPALTTNAYARLFLSSTGTTNVTVDNAEIIPLSGNIPIYNQFTGGNWVQTNFPVNAYAKIFVLAVPMTNDVTSQKKRFIFIQPQLADTSLATIQSITPSTINLGTVTGLLPEFAFIAEIIIRYQSGNWTLISVSKLTGTRFLQSSSPAGAFLSSVATDGVTITGNGTPSSPITWSGAVVDSPKGIAGTGKAGFPLALTGGFSPASDSINSWAIYKANTSSDPVFFVDTANDAAGLRATYTPTQDYHVATKKYVDDNAGGGGGGSSSGVFQAWEDFPNRFNAGKTSSPESFVGPGVVPFFPSIFASCDGTSSFIEDGEEVANASGVLLVNLGTDLGDRVNFWGLGYVTPGLGEITCEARIRIASEGDNSCYTQFKLAPNSSDPFPYIVFTNQLSGNDAFNSEWACTTETQWGSSSQGGGTFALDTWHNLKMVVSADGSTIDWYVDGVAEAQATFFTWPSGTQYNVELDFENIGGTAGRKIYVDYIAIKQVYTLSR